MSLASVENKINSSTYRHVDKATKTHAHVTTVTATFSQPPHPSPHVTTPPSKRQKLTSDSKPPKPTSTNINGVAAQKTAGSTPASTTTDPTTTPSTPTSTPAPAGRPRGPTINIYSHLLRIFHQQLPDCQLWQSFIDPDTDQPYTTSPLNLPNTGERDLLDFFHRCKERGLTCHKEYPIPGSTSPEGAKFGLGFNGWKDIPGGDDRRITAFVSGRIGWSWIVAAEGKVYELRVGNTLCQYATLAEAGEQVGVLSGALIRLASPLQESKLASSHPKQDPGQGNAGTAVGCGGGGGSIGGLLNVGAPLGGKVVAAKAPPGFSATRVGQLMLTAKFDGDKLGHGCWV
ncbi:hypothetical protein BDZ91DRAFT_710180 [Kalaharituber pfeilii]|nr:hypothetical protein BDZ91DRAFT_710180 [Kalaharituber pfeilii]